MQFGCTENLTHKEQGAPSRSIFEVCAGVPEFVVLDYALGFELKSATVFHDGHVRHSVPVADSYLES